MAKLTTEQMAGYDSAGERDADVKRVIDSLMARRLAREEEEYQKGVDEKENFRRVRKLQVEEERAYRDQVKKLCGHRKPDGKANIAGQRTGNGKYMFICQFCMNTWEDIANIPGDLRSGIDPDNIGGPNY